MTNTIRRWQALVGGAAALTAAACAESPTAASDAAAARAALAAALTTVPIGFGDLSSSYVGTAAAGVSDGALWLGGGRGAAFGRGDLMGGGLGDPFLGLVSFGPGGRGHQGPFGGGLGCAGTYNAATQRVECPAETRNGLTITRSASYANAAGQAQQAFDTLTTNTVNIQSRVSGAVEYTRPAAGASGPGGHRGPPGWGHGRGDFGRLLGDTATILSATTTVSSTSTRTVTGLAQGSPQRTVNGASTGTESTTGKSSRGSFTATRAAADTTRGLVVPVRAAADATHPYPTAGTVIRVIQATLTYAGQAPATLSRREVVTYNGSATATVVVTENGTTKTCTRALPRGPLVCP